MEEEIFRKIGLTEGEIKVYLALANLGKSSTGAIMKSSGISSSKVYLILEKLIQKGLASFIIENNVKKFQLTNPKTIKEYIEKQQQELEKVKKESEKLINFISKINTSAVEEDAQVYKGFAGLKVAFNNLLENLDEEEYLFFSQSKEEFTNKKIILFFNKLHQRRVKKGIRTKGIADINLKELFKKNFTKQKRFEAKFSKLSLPTAISIGKDRVLLNIWGDNPICFEIVSERITMKYRKYFEKMWDTIKD